MGSLKGVVIDKGNQPVPNASVFIVAGPSHIDLVLLSDEEGHFDFGNIEPGEYNLRAVAGNVQSQDIPITVSDSRQATIKIQIDRSNSVRPESPRPNFKSYPSEKGSAGDTARFETSNGNEIDEIP